MSGNSEGVYHAGEIAVQVRAGTRDDARRMAGSLGPALPPWAASLLSTQRMAVAASAARDGRVWASLLKGRPGFLRPIDDRLLLIEGRPTSGDPLSRNLSPGADLGLLVIDLATRRRLRLNGKALQDPEHGIFLSLNQAYGNCPQYIHPRSLDPAGLDAAPAAAQVTPGLEERHRAWIHAADTFFIASSARGAGADASHRGGPPGFVSAADQHTLAFPDYPGNGMFNTLGNVSLQPQVGLLFPDFEEGHLLQVTGRATVHWDPRGSTSPRGPQRLVTVSVDEVVETRHGGVRHARGRAGIT
jgi:uncharacterized protein